MHSIANIKTKCAEIHFNDSSDSKFSIICICGKSLANYELFLHHFADYHLHKDKEVSTDEEQCQIVQLISSDNDDCLDDPLLILSSSPTSSKIDRIFDMPTTAPKSGQLDRTTMSTMLQHLKRHVYKPRNKPNMCVYCGRTFRRRYLLDTHLNIHTGRKPHQCERCGKQFRAISTLTRHLRTHEQRQMQQCQHCEKIFTHRSALLSHEVRHTQVRRWACKSCSKSFYTRNQMDTHQRKLHTNSTTSSSANYCDDLISNLLPFTCELCGNTYRSASMLSTHKLKKHYRLAKYCCVRCDKKFVDAEHLQQHQQIHVELKVP